MNKENLKVEEVKEGKTFRTKNYSLFSFLNGNRTLNPKQVRFLMKLMKSAGEHSLSKFKIVVNNKKEIIDGQHRFDAAVNLGHYIYYTIVNNGDLDTVIDLNGNALKWTVSDFMNSHHNRGNSEYSVLKQFSEHYQINPAVAQALLTGNSKDGGVRNYESFRNGGFKVTSLAEATEIMEKVVMLESKFPNARSRGFIIAIQKLFYMDNFSFDRLYRKLSLDCVFIEKATNCTAYLKQIQSIYNKWEPAPKWMCFVKA